MNLLIVDDSDLFSDRFAKMLSNIPELEIIGEARDVSEAKDFIKRSKPDVVTLDIRMPNGNGIEVLKSAKLSRKKIKVIVVTNYPYPQLRDKCLEEGADYFFDKLSGLEEVWEILNRWTAEQSNQRKKGDKSHE